MTRSSRKPPFCAISVIRKVNNMLKSNKMNAIINIYTRSSTILNKFIGFTFGVHNGKKFIPVKITDDMVGYKFGEFSPTRTYTGHTADKKATRK